MKLSEYVLAQQDREDIIGDLARDAAQDEGWPAGANSAALAAYLERQRAGEESFAALRAADREHRDQELT